MLARLSIARAVAEELMRRSILQTLFLSVLVVLVAFSIQPALAGVHGGGGGGGGSHGGGGGGWGYHGGGGGWGYHGGGGYGGWHGGYGGYHGAYWGGGWRGGYWGGWGWGYPSYCCGWGFGVSFNFGPYWGYSYPYAYGYPYYYPYYSYYPPTYYYAPTSGPPANLQAAPSNPAAYNPPSQSGGMWSPGVSRPNASSSSVHLIDATYRSSAGASAAYSVRNVSNDSPASVDRQFPATRAEVKNVIRALRAMPPAARERQLDSGRYSNLSDEELALVRDAARVPSAAE